MDSIHSHSQGGSCKRKHGKENSNNQGETEEDEIDNVYGLSMSMRKKTAHNEQEQIS